MTPKPTHLMNIERAKRLLSSDCIAYILDEYKRHDKPCTVIAIESSRLFKCRVTNDYITSLAADAGLPARTRKEISAIFTRWRNQAYLAREVMFR
jgi:hypothetical protein